MPNDSEMKSLSTCIADCDELISGKFIYAENMIEKILNDISENDLLYNLIAECMKNFNFDREFNKIKTIYQSNKQFVMPQVRSFILPFVFCVFVDIRDKKINLHEFIKTYFTNDENDNGFDNFANTLAVPFRDTILYCFNLTNKNQTSSEENSQTSSEETTAENNLSQEDIAAENDVFENVAFESEKEIKEVDAANEDKFFKGNIEHSGNMIYDFNDVNNEANTEDDSSYDFDIANAESVDESNIEEINSKITVKKEENTLKTETVASSTESETPDLFEEEFLSNNETEKEEIVYNNSENSSELLDKVQNFNSSCLLIINDIKREVMTCKKIKGDFETDVLYLISCMEKCTTNNDYVNMGAYIVALNHILMPFKTVKSMLVDLKYLLAQLYI